MRILKVLSLLFVIFSSTLFFNGCAGSVDRSSFTPQQKFDYALTLYKDESYIESIIEFEAILLQYPGSDVADDAQYYLGMSRHHKGEYLLGAYEFSKLIKNMPASPYIADAQYMLAECYYELSPSYTLDQRYTKKAIEEFQSFIEFFKTDERVKGCESKIKILNLKLAEKLYKSAKIYEKMDYTQAALNYYDNVSQSYHDTHFASEAHYDKIKLLVLKKRNQEAINSIDSFISKYAANRNVEELKEIKKQLLETPIVKK